MPFQEAKNTVSFAQSGSGVPLAAVPCSATGSPDEGVVAGLLATVSQYGRS